ncbi:15252_t:CDS:1, partial [Gigaspora rosea]
LSSSVSSLSSSLTLQTIVGQFLPRGLEVKVLNSISRITSLPSR